MIEKIEDKLNDFKEKVDKKFIGVYTFLVFGLVCVFAMDMSNNFKRQKQQMQDEYNRAMYEVVSYVNNVETELAKLQVTTTTKFTSTTLASIWKQSSMAKENLEQLPADQQALSNSAKYLAQVSDFSYSLMKQTISGEKITDEEYDQISQIYDSSKELADVMQAIYDDLNNGRIKWDELKDSSNQKLPTVNVAESVSNIDNIGKTFQNYEGLIYDGAYSDHLLTSTPKSLASDADVSQDQARAYITELFGTDNIEYINDQGESSGLIDLYKFNVKFVNEKSERNISITKKGCKLYLMISDRKVENEDISMDDAKQKGLEFLGKLGITDVKDTYYLKTENMAIINYAAVQDGVTLYPDLIKVKIALDDGEVCSAELQGYIFNHVTRTDIKPTNSIEKARAVINKNIAITSEGLAIIPTESKNEILTYEFKGKIDKREFIIYINTETLQEEEVFLILNTPGGILTM